jgi:hypothetical protein
MDRTTCSCRFVAIGAAAFARGCSGATPTGSSSQATSAASEALLVITDCKAESSYCEADAGDAGKWDCDDKYRACLGVFSSDGGKRFSFDGGGFPFPDAGVFNPAPKDAGRPFDDDLARIEACIDDLHSCIETTTTVDNCADDAVHCIEQVFVGRSGSSGSASAGSAGSSGFGSGKFVLPQPPPHGSSGSFVFPLPHVDGGVFPFPRHDGGRP